MAKSRYPSNAAAFSDRAASLISSGESANLFYAALEIRMGVEARLQSYVLARSETSAAVKKGWKIQDLAKGLEKAFKGSKDVVQLSYSHTRDDPPFAVFRYTPVTAELQKIAQRLGDYLHYREVKVERDDSWWAQFRQIVKRGQELLSLCASGQLMGPPLWYPRTGEIKLNVEFTAGDPGIEQMLQLAKTRQELMIEVTYIPVDQFYVAARL